jgi:uncharacterized protein (TIGR01777 family)
MRIVVSGATGFVGSRLSELLRQADHQVVALTRNAERARSKVPSLDAAHAWSPLSETAPAAAFEGADAVVHLAGETVVGRWTQAKRDAIRETRITGTRNLVNGLRDLPSKPSILVAASAIGFYGDRAEEELTETSASGDDFLSEICREWEAEAAQAEEIGIKVARVRIGVVLAEGGGALDAMLTPFKLGAGGPLGSGRQWWSWIHRDDLCGLILHLIERGESGVYNATAPHPMRQKDFARVLGHVLHRPSFMPAPAFALKIVLGGFATELLSSKKVLPRTTQATGFSCQFAELEPALRQALRR